MAKKKEKKERDTGKLEKIPLTKKIVDPNYNSEQKLLRSMFGGNPVLVDGSDVNPPQLNGDFMKGGGILNNYDYSKRTGRMFGLYK